MFPNKISYLGTGHWRNRLPLLRKESMARKRFKSLLLALFTLFLFEQDRKELDRHNRDCQGAASKADVKHCLQHL
jgi:hypothetical protein